MAVVVVLLAVSMFSAYSAKAEDRVPRFCYAGTCHATLHAAEADLRSKAGPYGDLWKKGATLYYEWSASGSVFRIRYYVEDQEPKILYKPGYLAGSMDSRDGICSAEVDPYNTTKCADEAEAVAGMMARYRAISPECTVVDIGYQGHHAEPYAAVRRTYGYGEIRFRAERAEKYYHYTVWCPGWGTPAPDLHKSPIVKLQNFDCPVGFQPKHADNPDYSDGGTGLDWPHLCEPTAPVEYIYLYNSTQTDSQAANCNPCFPATGDKARTEIDFSFAGRSFARHYHSLGQMQVGPDFGANWSHTFSGRLTSSYGDGRITEEGYLQTYSSGRGDQAAEEQLRVLPTGDFELTDAFGDTRRYDSQGRLLSMGGKDPRTSVVLSYDAKNRLERITDGMSRALVFVYERSRISSITLPDGSSATYTYDYHDNLVKVVRPDGTSRRYLYAEQGLAPPLGRNLLTGIIEGDVRYATFSYNESAKVTGSQLLADGQPVDAITITYNPDGSATSVNNLGDVRQHAIGGGQFRQITQTVDAQGTRSNGFSDSGRPTSSTDALGNRTTLSYVDSSSGPISQVMTSTEEAIGRIIRITRDADNRVVEHRVSQKSGAGEQLTSLGRHVYDAQGHVLFSCRYDTSQSTEYVCGSLVSAPGNVRQFQNTYCSDSDVAVNPSSCPLPGLQLTRRNPAGFVARFEYYADNDAGCASGGSCAYRKGDLRAQIDALGHRTEYLEYDAGGRELQIKRADGTEVERLYDPMGRMVTETLKGSVPADDRVSVFEYGSTGKLTRTVSPDGVWTRMHYDSANRLGSVEDSIGNRITYILDGAGNRVREEVLDSGGTLRRLLNRSFDTASRNTRVAGADGHAILLRYDGNNNVLESEDALGVVARQSYDGADRVVNEVQDSGGIAAQMVYEYASNGRVSSVVDPKGLRTTYSYNGFGDLIKQESPDSGSSSATVDAVGNYKTHTDARGITSVYQYDALNRLIGISYPDPGLDINYVYDTASASCASAERFAARRLSYVKHAGGSTAYCYDRFGQMVRKVQTVDGVSSTVRYGYTKGGRLAQLIYPDGMVVDYARDGLGRVGEVGLTRPGQARKVVLNQVSYAPFGPATGWTYGNGRTLQRPLDQDYRPVSVHDSASGGLSLGLGYDAVGAIAELKDGAGNAVLAQYDYDALGRLTQTQDGATGTPIETYAYDATGNRTALTTAAGTATYTYPANSHRLVAVDGEMRNYDATGNTLNIGSREFVYSDAGRMSETRQSGEVVERYTYNDRGERIQRVGASNDALLTIYDEAGQWLGNYSSTGQALQQAIWLDDVPVALVSTVAPGVPELAYIEPDHLGTPRVVIDPARNVAIWEWSNTSEVFGNQAPNSDPDGDGRAFELGLRFPGQQATDGAGLFYNYHRDYDAGSGRYVQSDPLGLAAGSSTYGYVGGMPTGAYDPKGLLAIRDSLLGPGQKRPDGTVYCDDGVVKPFINWTRLSTYERDCIGDCLAIHEQTHVSDATRSNPGVCRYGGWLPVLHPKGLVNFDNAQERLASEARAYAAELRCLAAKLSEQFCIGGTCKKVVRARINDIIKKILPDVFDGTYPNGNFGAE